MKKHSACLIGFCWVAVSTAQAQVRTMTFEGLQHREAILDFYNAGTGDKGSGPGPNFGVVFGGAAIAHLEPDENFAFEPTPPTIAYFFIATGMVMNVPAGFTGGLSLYYAAPFTSGSVTLWSGPDATGTLLATLPLPATGANCHGSDRDYTCWAGTGVDFSGTARSVDFSGAAERAAFDNITIGQAFPVAIPIPPTLVLVLAGLGGASAVQFRRRLRSRQ